LGIVITIVLIATLVDLFFRNRNIFKNVDLKQWSFITINNNDDDDDEDEMLENKPIERVEKVEHSLGVKILLAFSAYTNSIKLFTVKKQDGQLDCLNGIRTLSLGW
jgi:hypothetical protein